MYYLKGGTPTVWNWRRLCHLNHLRIWNHWLKIARISIHSDPQISQNIRIAKWLLCKCLCNTRTKKRTKRRSARVPSSKINWKIEIIFIYKEKSIDYMKVSIMIYSELTRNIHSRLFPRIWKTIWRQTLFLCVSLLHPFTIFYILYPTIALNYNSFPIL